MKKQLFYFLAASVLCLTTSLLPACSSNDDEIAKVDTSPTVDSTQTETDILIIQSGADSVGRGIVVRPNGFTEKEQRYERDGSNRMIYHRHFVCGISDSPFFYLLKIDFQNSEELSFDDFKDGDTFDSSQFLAFAYYYTPTWTEAVMKGASILSGKIQVVGRKKVDDMSLLTLQLIDLKFDAIDKSCVYSINGTIDYYIPSLTIQNEIKGVEGIVGIWQLREVLNGPVSLRDKNSLQQVMVVFQEDGNAIFAYEDGKIKTLIYQQAENQELYQTNLPVLTIGDVPFSYNMEEDKLYLHYLGVYLCDHIPATFVLERHFWARTDE